MKSLFILGLLSLSLNVFANEKGNGGDAVVCRLVNGRITKIELLDFYEGRTFRKMPHVFESNFSNEEYFELLGKKLKDFHPGVFEDFTSDALELNRSMEEFLRGEPQSTHGYIYTDAALVDIADSNHLSMPKGCKVEQLVVRLNRKFPEDGKFIVQEELLKALSADDLRGLILHEIIYKSLIEFYKVENSIMTRYLNQIITSRSFAEFRYVDYVEFLNGLLSSLRSATQTIPRHNLNLRPWHFKRGENYFHIFADFTGLILDYDGNFKRELTLAKEETNLRLEMRMGSKNDNCSQFMIRNFSVTDSKGKITNVDSWKNTNFFAYGNFKISFKAPAVSNEFRHCVGTQVFLDKKRIADQTDPETTFELYKMSKSEQVINLEMFLDIGEDMVPFLRMK